MKDIDKYLTEAVENIRNDRDTTQSLLEDVMKYLARDDSHHEKVGQVAAKYVETLQRSNEQLVKVAALLQKKENSTAGLTASDKNELFDIIKGGAGEWAKCHQVFKNHLN